MKATRFLNIAGRLAALAVFITVLSSVSLAQTVTLPVAPGVQTQFGRLSWSASFSNFDGIAGLGTNIMSFGVYGQGNSGGAANPNGHGFYDFGTFGNAGFNGIFGAGGHSTVTGAARNVGMWALAANATSTTSLLHTMADTLKASLSIGLEVGAGGGAVGSDGHVGVAIMVDSGDVQTAVTRDGGTTWNMTTVGDLTVLGTLKAKANNWYTQAASTVDVQSTPTRSAVVLADITDATNGNSDFSATSVATATTGSLFFGNATVAGPHLLKLQSGGANVFDVNTAGDLTIGVTATPSFTVAEATGNVNALGDLTIGASAAGATTKFKVAGTDGSITVGIPASPVLTVAGATGQTTVTAATTATNSAFTITNTNHGATHSLDVSGANETGYTTQLTNIEPGGGSTKYRRPVSDLNVGGNAALNVTHAAIIDTLDVSKQLEFGTDAAPAVVDFNNAIVIGLRGNNKFEQKNTADSVKISASTAAGVEIQMGSPNTGADINPAIIANQTSAGTGMIFEGQKAGADVFTVGNTGSLAIGVTKFTVAAASGNTNTEGNITTGVTGTPKAEIDPNGTISVAGSSVIATPDFQLDGATGKVTLTTAAATAGVAVTLQENSITGQALVVGGKLSTGYVSALQKDPSTGNGASIFTIPTGTATPYTGGVAGGSAALSVFRGAIIDTMDISGKMQFGTTLSRALVDFSNADVIGLSDSDAVQFRRGTPQLNNKTDVAGTATSIWIQQNNSTPGDFVHFDNKTGTTLTKIDKNGNFTIAPDGGGPAVTISSPGSNGTAVTIDNGGVRMTGGTQAAKASANITVAAGTHSATLNILSDLVEATSTIIVSAKCTTNGGTNGDTYVAQVTDQVANTLPVAGVGQFTVKVTCVEGDLPFVETVVVNYFIINH